MGKVAARFYVSRFEKKPDGTATVHLQPVHSKENARWSQYTPSGSIQMDLTRKASGARKAFEAAVDAPTTTGRKAECLVTFDFDAPAAEAPGRAQDENGKDIGYATDEAE
jgi:hypothetical protein